MSQTKYSSLHLSQYWEKFRKHPSLYALFKHTYNAYILTKKFSDETQPFMNSFLKKFGSCHSKNIVLGPKKPLLGPIFQQEEVFRGLQIFLKTAVH